MMTRSPQLLAVFSLLVAACGPSSWVEVQPEFVEEARQSDDSVVRFELTVENLTERTLDWGWTWDGDGEVDMSIFRIGPLEEFDAMRVPFVGFCEAIETADGHVSGLLEIRLLNEGQEVEDGRVVRRIPVDLDCR